MSVILTNMEMPNSCYECHLKTRCEYALANGWLGNKRDDNCPLKPCEERKGIWIKVNPFLIDTFECSECGWQVCTEELLTPYCPWCGAKMEE